LIVLNPDNLVAAALVAAGNRSLTEQEFDERDR
jgi:hypothetical protein